MYRCWWGVVRGLLTWITTLRWCRIRPIPKTLQSIDRRPPLELTLLTSRTSATLPSCFGAPPKVRGMTHRTTSERVATALARLETEANVWVASASAEGVPHLLPLSLAWDGNRILVATPTDSPTVRNITSTGRARASLDSAVQVVILDADAEAVDFDQLEPDKIKRFVDRVGWDPREEPGEWSLLVLTPRLVHAWNTEGEIQGRTIMRRGEWVT